MSDPSFQPRFLLDAEIGNWDLPSTSQVPNIMTMVDAASSLIDSYCGRIDSDGTGSLIYSTYEERILLVDQKNIFRVSHTPFVALTTITQLQLSGLTAVSGDHFYTGFIPNTLNDNTGSLSPIVGVSGRYSYGRKSSTQVYPDSQYAANILQVAAFFGGPPAFVPIDVTMCDHLDGVGECWVPAGLMMASYSELLIIYNSGLNPLALPRGLKHATASIVKNFIVRGGGITGVRGYSAGKIHTQFDESLIDSSVAQWLLPHRKVVAL